MIRPNTRLLRIAGAAMLSSLILAAPVVAEDGSSAADRLKRLRQQLRNRQTGRDEGAKMTATGSAGVPVPAAALPKGVKDNALKGKDLDQMVRAAASEEKMDLETVKQGGFEPFSPSGKVHLTYDVKDLVSSEYLLEIHAMLRVPGKKKPVPHRRLYTIVADPLGKDDEGKMEWEYKIVDARQSNLVVLDKGYREVLVKNTEEVGAIIPLTTDVLGVEASAAAMSADDKVLQWLRLRLPAQPSKVGFGWRTKLPRRLGSEMEYTDGLYLLHRMARLEKDREVAVVRGRFRTFGAEQMDAGENPTVARTKKMGQDRVLFDVASGRVLYREFRMEGAYQQKTPKGSRAFQARIKGILLEKSLLAGLDGPDRVRRLNAANAIFGG